MGGDGFPYLAELGEVVRAVWTGCACRVLIASPRGLELLVADERLLVARRVPALLHHEANERNRSSRPYGQPVQPASLSPRPTKVPAELVPA
jgi:hypothetical protein